jgi:hypothetical protein
MGEIDFNVTNKEIIEPTYLEVSNITLNFKHQKHQG